MTDIKIEKLSFAYEDKQVIKNLSLRLKSGRPVLLLGQSGRGKTTLMRLILGFLKPQEGSIQGTENKVFAVMYQEDRLFPQLSVYKNLKLIKKDLSRGDAETLLRDVNLESGVLDKLPKELSGGMKRRIALIRALIFPSDVLLLDEPFQGLDSENRSIAQRAVKKYTGDRAALIISHRSEDAKELGAELRCFEDISEGCVSIE